RDQTIEDVILIAHRHVIGIGEDAACWSIEDKHETVWIGNRLRPHQRCVDDTEDRSIRSNPERQSKHRNHGKPRPLQQPARSKSNVFKHKSYRSYPTYSYRSATSGSTFVALRAGR